MCRTRSYSVIRLPDCERLVPVFRQVIDEGGLQIAGAEEVVPRTLEGTGDGAGARISLLDIHDEGAAETVILEEGLVLVAPVAFEGTVLGLVPGPGSDIDLAAAEDDCVSAGFGEDDSGALLFQIVRFRVSGIPEPGGEVAASHFDIDECLIETGEGEVGFVEDPVATEALVDRGLGDVGGYIGVDGERIPAAAVDENLGGTAAEHVDDDLAEPLQEIGSVREGEVTVEPDVAEVQVLAALDGGRGILGDDVITFSREFDGFDGAGSVRNFKLTDNLVSLLSSNTIFLVAGGEPCDSNENCACQNKQFPCNHGRMF